MKASNATKGPSMDFSFVDNENISQVLSEAWVYYNEAMLKSCGVTILALS